VRLEWFEARDFRSYQGVSLRVPDGLIVVAGPNAQGKTNLLEAMYYLCALVSPRVSNDLPLVRHGAGAAYLRGEVQTTGGRFLVEVEVRSGGANRVQVNRSPVRRKRDVRRHVRAVFSGPDDLSVVQGDPGERRRFIDEAVAVLWPPKDGLAAAYERVLRQRNRLLKDWEGGPEPQELPAWDEQLVRHGAALTGVREQAVEAIVDRAGEEFRRLSGEPLVVRYLPSVEGGHVEGAFRARLAERRDDELARRVTLVGPHRDDVGLWIQGLAARGFASHGEAWAAAVCLRLALSGAVATEQGEQPMTFLDDPFSGLDPARRRLLAGGLEGRGQVLIAVPEDPHLVPGAVVWRVEGGRVVTD
jgi:DNA replication and repair protein RecF